MVGYNDLEIQVLQGDAEHYSIMLRLIQHFTLHADISSPQVAVPHSAFETLGTSISIATSFEDYGRQLSNVLFSNGNATLLEFYKVALALTRNNNRALRLRLNINDQVRRLHAWRWESLWDPSGTGWLLTDDNVLFSRDVRVLSKHQPLRLSYRRDLTGMIAVADPPNLNRQEFPEIGSDKHIKLAKESMKELCSAGLEILNQKGYITFERLIDGCRHRDVVYLAAHGALLDNDSNIDANGFVYDNCEDRNKSKDSHFIWLQKDDGMGQRVPAQTIVEALASMRPDERPRLIVLATCDSAKTSEALVALGPLLMQCAAIPAVVAMQDKVTIETVEQFIPAFFQSLAKHGEVDRAMAVARRSLPQEGLDRWMPTLYMGLKYGSIWGAGFSEGNNDDVKRNWDNLLLSIHNETCVPVLGPDLLEPLIGSPRYFAKNWADEFETKERVRPFSDVSRYSLTQVTQYLSAYQLNQQSIKEQYLARMQEAINLRYNNILEQQGVANVQQLQLPQLIAALANTLLHTQPDHPYYSLATMPFPLIITANPDNLLACAMSAIAAKTGIGKNPEVATFLWSRELNLDKIGGDEYLQSIFDRKDDFKPNLSNPLIYHLLGRLEVPRSLVVTEDDFFDYLMHINLHIAASHNNAPFAIPSPVAAAMKNRTMLFLGFQPDDWSFRVLLRSIAYLGDEGRATRMAKPLTIAVQIDPQFESRDPREVRFYLQNHYQLLGNIKIYWGNTVEFIQELGEDFRSAYPNSMPVPVQVGS